MFLGLLLAASLAAAGSPPVQVSLRTSWPASPFLVEVIETLALESPVSFFPFLDCVTDSGKLQLPPNSRPEAVHQATLALAVSHGFLPDAGALAAVEMNLALHAASPKIQAFYHHYNTTNGEREVACESWVDWYDTAVCDVETLAQLARIETIDPTEKPSSKNPYNRPKVLPFDHIYPPPSLGGTIPPRTAILYASLNSPNFRELHEYLYKLAAPKDGSPLVEYVLRHAPPKDLAEETAKAYLSGFNVALDLKKMDYLAVDDRHVKQRGAGANNGNEVEDPESIEPIDPIPSLINAYPEPEPVEADFATTPDEDSDPQKEKEKKEREALGSLGLQAVQLLYDSGLSHNPIQILAQLSQNFPKYFPLLNRPNGPRIPVSPELAEEMHNNQLRAQPGGNMLWINGQGIQDGDVGPFELLRILKKERGIIKTLTSFKLGEETESWLSNAQAIELLTHPKMGAAQDSSGGGAIVDGLVDMSDREEGEGSVVVWWNDIEKDSRYSRWQPSIHAILQPLYPGQFPSVRLNLFNVVLVADLSKTSSINFLAGAVSSIIQRNFPFRWGIVPFGASDDGIRMARLFYYLVQNHGRKNTMELLRKISTLQAPPDAQPPTVKWDDVRSAFAELIADSDPEKAVGFDDVLSGKSGEKSEILDKVETSMEKSQAYARRLGLEANGGQGHAFVNGKYIEMGENLLNLMQMETGNQLRHVQEQLYEGHIVQPSPEDLEEKPFSMSNYFNDLPTTSKRRNKYIVPASNDRLKLVNLPEVTERSGWEISKGGYVYPTGSEVVPVTIYVVADFNGKDGLSVVKEALLSIGPDSPARISFIHNPINPTVPETLKSPPVSALFAHLVLNGKLESITPAALLNALGFGHEINWDADQVPLTQGEQMRSILGGLKPKDLDYVNHTRFTDLGRNFLKEAGINPGDKGLIINGRVIAPLGDNDFLADDFKALEVYEMQKRVKPVVETLEDVKGDLQSLERTSLSDLIPMISSFIAAIQRPDPSEVGLFDTPQRPRTRNYQTLESKYTCFDFGDNTTAIYQIAVLLDPLSETAQRWSSLLEWISHIPDVAIEVHLNPAKYTEVPLKRFFRYSLRPALKFDEDGYEIAAQTQLQGLPVEPIYTLAIGTPSSWLVRPREALYDLDNIQLNHLAPEDSSVDAVFELDYLVVEGHARDQMTNAPPRGVQLELTSGDATVDDTQVVANLGYFQFKATPGVFRLGIREGRGRDIFEMESVGNEGWDSPGVEEVGDEITVTSFEGLTLYPRLRRKKGMERADVLAEDDDDDEEDHGLIGKVVNSFKSIFGSKEEETALSAVPGTEQAEINIFTVASGLLYERFVGIMILSVLRNTNSTVKFWFIENFLSPSFLEFIPHLASAYNFQYELVTYKWPSWLRAQKEKQRIIWAYKILFLDVLFPMDLKKVIFVDADQIVRADLKELVDLDLKGAPYGYTPMGDDNYDMEGFRFWKTGYWKDFLQGRPYHISALYVVDLVRFRQIAAGDILRGQYQALSADPNSLANLDQDLPNNIQREVPIFSLHEDWLWCETWCSKDRLDRAKTIDLCQNPLTKEPKLSRARQIPEWEEYDSEIARFARKLAEEGKIKSRIATADANVLASGSGAGSTKEKDEEGKAAAPEIEIEKEEGKERSETPRDEL
ncbi:killer toxin resistant protein [Marasmius crinis-equi]|uniref:Killer toxin resistant protein n=1 Tax=Marasmius crinis-equi TaxID=585013 RepID=A0ABR3FU38_9AGAR